MAVCDTPTCVRACLHTALSIFSKSTGYCLSSWALVDPWSVILTALEQVIHSETGWDAVFCAGTGRMCTQCRTHFLATAPPKTEWLAFLASECLDSRTHTNITGTRFSRSGQEIRESEQRKQTEGHLIRVLPRELRCAVVGAAARTVKYLA